LAPEIADVLRDRLLAYGTYETPARAAPTAGVADTLEEAETAFRAAWER
jgi:hypothetical protein